MEHRASRRAEAVHDPTAETSPGRPDWRHEVARSSTSNLVAGLWVVASPWVLNYRDADLVVLSVAVGSAIALLAAARALKPDTGEWASWTNALLGACLASLAIWLPDTRAAVWNTAVIGALVCVLGAWSASTRSSRL